MNPKQYNLLIRGLMIAFAISSMMTVVTAFFYFSKVTVVNANSSDYSSLRSQYSSIIGTRLDTCSFCHTSSIPSLNAYGSAYKNAGRSSAAFGAIANLDSDRDGFANAQEISALFFPGDANDHPAAVPTATQMPPTATPVTPTATPVQPTTTQVAPTSTMVPPTVTLEGPTNTPGVPTDTPVVEPTATEMIPPTATPEPTLENSPTPEPTLQCIDDDEDEGEDDKDEDEHEQKNNDKKDKKDKDNKHQYEKDRKDKDKSGKDRPSSYHSDNDDDDDCDDDLYDDRDEDHDDEDDDDEEHSQSPSFVSPLGALIASLLSSLGF